MFTCCGALVALAGTCPAVEFERPLSTGGCLTPVVRPVDDCCSPSPSGGHGLVGTLIHPANERMHARARARLPARSPTCPSARLHAHMHARTLVSARLLNFTWQTSCYTCPALPRCARKLFSRLFTSVKTWLQVRGVGRVRVRDARTHARTAHACSNASWQQLQTKYACACARVCGRTSELAYADPTMHVSARALSTAADQQMRVYVRVRLSAHQQ